MGIEFSYQGKPVNCPFCFGRLFVCFSFSILECGACGAMAFLHYRTCEVEYWGRPLHSVNNIVLDGSYG